VFDIEYSFIFAFITSLIITYLAIPKVIVFADKYRLSDVPGKRSSHKRSVPVFGGLAIFSGVIFSMFIWGKLADIQFIVLSFLIVFFVGVIDDLLSLTPFKKLFGQIIAILIVVYLAELKIDSMHGVWGIYDLPDFIATLFTIFVVVVITNAFNLIDGVDGLASGIGFISSFFFGLIAVLMSQLEMAVIAFSLMGALFGFMKYNFNPARIFMGDSGSLLVGMILSVLAINNIRYGLVFENFGLPNKGPLMAIVFLSIPLFDSLRVFVVRLIKGKHPLYPGREHIHHVLLDLGLGHKGTAISLYSISLLLVIGSYFLLDLNINLSISFLAIVVFTILLIPIYLRKNKK
tara:strand:+ start:3363 stop:4403 length:1041 start_codon:yes stop_codon:yes gene_type:complete